MKELSIEEKAKLYDEAYARMSRAYNDNRCSIGFMNEIFPRPKESEDERIRKAIIDFFSEPGRKEYILNGFTVDNIIAWLEKRGEQKPAEWSEEDENNILFLTAIIEECFKGKEEITLYGDTVCAHFTKENIIERLKSLRPQKQWKPSEEQIEILDMVLTELIYGGKIYDVEKVDYWGDFRNKAAIAAMQAFIGKFNINIRDIGDCEKISKLAVEQTDALIKELKNK